ncbi:hypothetical protein PsalN5692_00150 [Piscirickettsia salmonis]|uniref:DUF6622 family protein n=1 Tax=Piscirickettsia salmonis TaxID=1238 RepID=UPI0012B811B6|nr:hypothetical protein PsalN5692_00150 [Piscirickettsia salmonis]QGP52772.1 hypothetical protein PsalSR1_00162 [Piscirickettsia salmonis]QGP57635.1 hypothetical protein PsalBI1_00172 [Piscirickettsia salmonis]QGP62340.1 hypothetical protein PsalMR5_00162 [Piscirickettsia salmonis]
MINTNNSLYLALVHTPLWVYLLLVAFLKRGINALSPSTHSIYRLTIIPTLFLFSSLHTLTTSSQSLSNTLILWCLGLSAGLVIACFNTPRAHIQPDYKQRTVTVPGSPYMLILLLCAFITKYTVFYQITIAPQIIYDFTFSVILLTTTGLFTGLSIGRNLCLSYRYCNNSNSYFKESMQTSIYP